MNYYKILCALAFEIAEQEIKNKIMKFTMTDENIVNFFF